MAQGDRWPEVLVAVARRRALGEREAAAVERHLRSCAPCAKLAAGLASMRRLARERPGALPPIAHLRGRLRLLREAAAVEAPRSVLGRRLAVFAMVALIVLGIGALFHRETKAEIDVVTLETGTLDIAVRKLSAGERFLVRTADAEVEVRGTQFRVTAESAKLLAVEVAEGRVEVRRIDGAVLLEPGNQWRARVGAGALADEAPAAAKAADAPAPAAPPSAPPLSLPSRGEPQRSNAPGAATPVKAPATAGSGASEAFREGVQRMAQGDYGAAAERLRSFAEAHPGDARAEDAAFLAVLSLQRAGRKAEAAAAARRYLAAYPNGYRRAEAAASAGQ